VAHSVNRSALLLLGVGHAALSVFWLAAGVRYQNITPDVDVWLLNLSELVVGVTYHAQLLLLAFWLVFGPGRLVVRGMGAVMGVILLTTLLVIPWLLYVSLDTVVFPHLAYVVIIPLTSACTALTAFRLWGWRLVAIDPDSIPVDGRRRPQFSLRFLMAIMLAAALLCVPLTYCGYPVGDRLLPRFLGGDDGRLLFLFRVFVTIPLVAAGLANVFLSARFGWRRMGLWLALWVCLEQIQLPLAGRPFPSISVWIMMRWKNAMGVALAATVLVVSLWCLRRAGYRLIRGLSEQDNLGRRGFDLKLQSDNHEEAREK